MIIEYHTQAKKLLFIEVPKDSCCYKLVEDKIYHKNPIAIIELKTSELFKDKNFKLLCKLGFENISLVKSIVYGKGKDVEQIELTKQWHQILINAGIKDKNDTPFVYNNKEWVVAEILS